MTVRGMRMTIYKGQKKPYTVRGIKRVPCAACGDPSVHQWSVCANGNRYMGLCDGCDYGLNEHTLLFFKHTFKTRLRNKLLKAYKLKLRREK